MTCWFLHNINCSFFFAWITSNQSVNVELVSYSPLQPRPLPCFPTHSPLFLSLLFNHQVPRQMAPGSTTAKLVGALLESSHTGLGQHLFMNRPTITHPPTSTADRGVGGGSVGGGRGGSQVTKKQEGGISPGRVVTPGEPVIRIHVQAERFHSVLIINSGLHDVSCLYFNKYKTPLNK